MQSDEAFGDFRETDGNAVVAADLDVWVVLLECLIEVPEDLETIPFEAKRGDQSEIAVVRGSQFEKNSPYDGYGREGIRLEVVPRLEECIHPCCLGFPCWGKEHWEP